jgi:hypothetical protein
VAYQVGKLIMSDDTQEEASFRERYAKELRKKKQQNGHEYRGSDELADEKMEVNQQQMKTPGRRGEQIKQEELDKEFVSRDMMSKKESKQKKVP